MIALVAATLGFALVGTTASRARATLSADLQRTWSTPYDLLVRPRGAQSSTELSLGLVRPNFIGAIHGGITGAQLDVIRATAGVTTAAPVAPVGFVEWPSAYVTKLPPADEGSPARLYRIRTVATGDAGLSRYPIDERYVVSARAGILDIGSRLMQLDGRTISCSGFTNCFGGEVCRSGECEPGGWPGLPDTRYYLPLLQPISIAGIDPVAEDRMAGLSKCITTGRMLTDADVVTERHDDVDVFTTIPVLLADRTFIDQELTITVDEAVGASDLSMPTQTSQWKAVSTVTRTVDDLYRAFIPSLNDYQDPWPVWHPGDAGYGLVADRHLRAETTAHQDLFAMSPLSTEFDVPTSVVVPPEERDTSFRSVIAHPDRLASQAEGGLGWRLWSVVGTYDPTCLPGFDPLAGGPLETYSYPAVTLPDGSRLAPNRSMAGYVNSPPLILTSLDGAKWLSDPAHYAGQPGDAFIGAVRVVTEGSATPTQEAYEKLLTIAESIRQDTGLVVDVVKGGSPVPVAIDLPAGLFGRPDMTVKEGWTAKGVAVRLAAAVSGQDIAFGVLAATILVLLVSVTFVVAVEVRRPEYVTLEALGWGRRSVAHAMQAEFVIAGALASIAAIAVVIAVQLVVGGVSALTFGIAAAAPAALGALLGGFAVARTARPEANADDQGSLAVRGFVRIPTTWRLAALELRRGQPWLTALAGVGIGVGVGLTSVSALIAVAFGGTLQVSALDRQVAFTVSPFHWLLGALVLVATAASLTQVNGLAHRRRRRRLAMLRAIGWPRRDVVRLEVFHAVLLGLGSAAIPSIVTVVLGVGLGYPVAGLAVGTTALCAGVLVALGGALPSIRGALSVNANEALRPTG